MNIRFICLFAFLLSPAAQAQWPGGLMRPLPVFTQAPLLFVRISAPPGVETTFYQGTNIARSYPTPVIVGLRPGYCYRCRLTRLPEFPGVPLYPSIEVHGSLKLGPKVAAATFPATVHLTQQDIEAAAQGTLVSKVVYLEDPDRAEPTSTRPGEILETPFPIGTDLKKEAQKRGRVILVVHIGGRTPTEEELSVQNVAGTILFPGEKSMTQAARPPFIPSNGPGFHDPIHGPRPLEEECLHDGGDRLNRVGFGLQGQLGGLDPEDTVAEFRDSSGRRQLSCSNRLCLCAPRFAALRTETPLASTENVMGPLDRRLVKREVKYEATTRSSESSQIKRPQRVESRERPAVQMNVEKTGQLVGLKVLTAVTLDFGVVEYIGTKKIDQLTLIQKAQLLQQLKLALDFTGVEKLARNDQVTRTAIIGRVKGGPEVVSANVKPFDLTVCCCEAPITLDKPLVLVKCADRGHAQVGDEVTFTLRYTNTGTRTITDVAVSDSLSGRLEYVAGSAETDRDAVFTMQANEAGSLVLRWEINGNLLPGQTGRIRFKARVR